MAQASIKQRLMDETKRAMKAGEKERVATLRRIQAALKQREIDDRTTLDDSAALAILDKLAKQHRESIEQYEAAGRDDLVAKERGELEVIAEFLPQPLSDGELDALIEQALQTTGATSLKQMGQVMAELQPRVQGRAEMSDVSARVKARLS
ncbi:MAG: glutamyl-tRNA amidotransferase [Proteobacteria bacterium SW_6_67_9]|nr:MAG: glutamyl-tRNA amidotransferase [Proteobacteria bacterium SW_6_67_9]